MGKTSIGYADYTTNFTKWFCTKVSEGCKHCYMMRLAALNPQHSADKPEWRQRAVDEFRNLPTGAVCFANDMLDWFHEDMPDEWIGWMLQVFASRPDVTVLTLTKRIERLAKYAEVNGQRWGENVWIGTSVENEKRAYRIDVLRAIPAVHRWISFEPLIAPVFSPQSLAVGLFKLDGIEQVVTGGESGEFRRVFVPEYALAIKDECRRQGVAFYHKQGGNEFPGQDRLLAGQLWDDLVWYRPTAESHVQGSLF